jgi:ubiquinone/menaquinone biosynthesis C-methylase UbiE
MNPSKSFLDRFEFKESYLAVRETKARKILRVLEREVRSLSSASLLDIGCSQGQITAVLSEHFSLTVGVDSDSEVHVQTGKVNWVQADGCYLPFASEAFDVVVMNHVLEHVAFSQLLLDEAWRILKPQGMVYLACPNRLTLVEPHYHLPFLSWLPRSWADRYVRLFGRGEKYEDNLPSRWKLLRMTRQFQTTDLTLEMLLNSQIYFPEDQRLCRQVRWLRWLPKLFLKWALPILPVMVLSLKKGSMPGGDRTPVSSTFPKKAEHVSRK